MPGFVSESLQKERSSLKHFLIPLTESLYREVVKLTHMHRKKVGRPSDVFVNVWKHLPAEGKKR